MRAAFYPLLQNSGVRVFAFSLQLFFLFSFRAFSQVDLTQALSYSGTSATYTYYSKQTGGTLSYFTTPFYPGSLHAGTSGDGSLTDGTTGVGSLIPNPSNAGSTATSISFASGDLTDYSSGAMNLSSTVDGWVDVTSNVSTSSGGAAGSFNILFNLGAVYSDIYRVDIYYTDSSGRRWITTAGAQTAYYGTTAPVASSTSLATSLSGYTQIGSTTAVNGATNAVMSITGTAFSAQYIVLDLSVNVSGNAASPGSAGGIIDQVVIYQIPEPSVAYMLGVAVLLFCGWKFWQKKRRLFA